MARIIVRYDEDGAAAPDGKALEVARSLITPEEGEADLTNIDRAACPTTSTLSVITACRLLRKRGDIDDLVILYGDGGVALVDSDGRMSRGHHIYDVCDAMLDELLG